MIFIHGFMGSPNQFKQMAEAAKDLGFAVSVMLLPGHGGTIEEFSKSGKRQWEEAVNKHIGQMSKKYSKLILVGHSMGSLLAFSSYEFFSDAIIGIVAVATPLYILVKSRILKTCFKVMFGRINEENPWENAAEDLCSVKGKSAFGHTKSVPRFFDLFSLISVAKKSLGQIEVPTLVIHSAGDEVANIKSVDALEKKLKSAQILRLYHSGHFYYSEQDTEIIIEKYTQFLNKLK